MKLPTFQIARLQASANALFQYVTQRFAPLDRSYMADTLPQFYVMEGTIFQFRVQRYNKKMRYANKFAKNGKIATKDAIYFWARRWR